MDTKRCVLFLLNVVVSLQLHEYTNYGTDNTVPNIKCKKHETFNDLIKNKNKTIQNYETLEIFNCPAPASYRTAIEALNINSTSIRRLTLYNIREQLKASQFAELCVDSLHLDFMVEESSGYTNVVKYKQYDVDFIGNLSLRSLHLSGLLLPPLPPHRAPSLALTAGASLGALGDCARITHLKLSRWDLTNIPDRFLSNCSQLTSLTVEDQPELKGDQVGRLLRGGVSSLRSLVIRSCYLDELDTELAGAERLELLDLRSNQLHSVLVNTRLPSLTTLDISYNHIFGSALLATALEGQPKLKNLTVDHNPYMDPCDVEVYRVKAVDAFSDLHEPLKGRQLSLPRIERLSLAGSGATSLCLNNMRLDELRHLNIANNHIDNLQLLGLPVTNQSYTLNVSGNPISKFPFDQPEYDRLEYQVTLVGLPPLSIDCVCSQHMWLGRALRERKLLADVTCQDGRQPATVGKEEWECEKITCAGSCSCRRKLNSTETAAKCDDSLTDLPEDLINALLGNETGVNVTELDLSNNRLARLNASQIAALFSNERRVRLAGNPLLCDCENEDMVLALQKHRHQIADYASLACTGRDFSLQFAEDLCAVPVDQQVWFTASLAVAGAVLGGAALLAAAYCTYKKEIKIYLYSRGFCLCCVKENELDSHRRYDAFISFSHKDEAFVTEQFLPKIDKQYKICIHYRDWIAGEMIPNQIVKSVENSRRTIIILSKNFLESIWGLLEFKTAHTSALTEGRVRVIIVVIDDIINDSNLDDELRNYLRTNTYIKWGEPWFWRKLCYALPHDSVRDTESGLGRSDSGLELDQYEDISDEITRS